MTWVLLALLAAPAGAAWTPVPRKIAVVYHPKDVPGGTGDVFFHPVHQRAEVVLNYLGLEAEYLDASRPLPDPSTLKEFRGALIWGRSAAWPADPRVVCRWLNRLMGAGLRVAIVGQAALHTTGEPYFHIAPECAEVFRRLGLRSEGVRTVDGLSVSSAAYDGDMLGFERKPDVSEAGIIPLVSLLPGGTPFARLTMSDGEREVLTPVASTPRGAVALDPFWLYLNEELEPARSAWVTDPFAFFETAFALRGLPRPDPTTLSGRRMLMHRVDGDGFFNLSELDRRKLAGEIFLTEVLEKNQDLPFTIGLIAGYYDLPLYSDKASLALSRRVFDRGHVEPASHGYAHPLVWSEGTLALRIPRYEMDPVKEVAGSAALLRERLLSAGSKLDLFLWTGDGRPGAADLGAAAAAGLLNMNGGGGRFDRTYPSYSNLWPLGRTVGGLRQVYAASFNENDYTNLWSGPYYGYRDVVETFERTGSPRRIKPVDVYVHFYSAERYASLVALKRVMAWARERPLIPVFGGRYARAVAGFHGMRVSRDGARFLLEGGAQLRTVRFDGEKRWPDLRASRGVIGYRREGAALYVHLDESDRREVALAERETPGPRLEEANFEATNWSAARGAVRFSLRRWTAPEAVLAGLQPGGAYRFEGRLLKADATGRLRLKPTKDLAVLEPAR